MGRNVHLAQSASQDLRKGISRQLSGFVDMMPPDTIDTDWGRNFKSRLFSALCQILEIKKSRITSYPDGNGQVENVSKTVEKTAHGAIDTDWGRNFKSGLFSALCHILEIKKSRITSDPDGNGQVENASKTVKKTANGLSWQWAGNVGSAPETLSMGYGSTELSSTGYKPYSLMGERYGYH